MLTQHILDTKNTEKGRRPSDLSAVWTLLLVLSFSWVRKGCWGNWAKNCIRRSKAAQCVREYGTWVNVLYFPTLLKLNLCVFFHVMSREIALFLFNVCDTLRVCVSAGLRDESQRVSRGFVSSTEIWGRPAHPNIVNKRPPTPSLASTRLKGFPCRWRHVVRFNSSHVSIVMWWRSKWWWIKTKFHFIIPVGFALEPAAQVSMSPICDRRGEERCLEEDSGYCCGISPAGGQLEQREAVWQWTIPQQILWTSNSRECWENW